jgi:endo-1,4-beta-D-glucanase Y
MKRAALALTVMATLVAAPVQAESMILPSEWTSYVENYVAEDGRVIDTANNGISHSESQGYGLVLSALADDQPTFERIWTFTSTQLMVRDDGLASWLWDPSKTPNLADTNNATDGDILIAYALALAGSAWDNDSYIAAARRIAGTVGRKLLVDIDGLVAILPGVDGFLDPEGVKSTVLNPSYWVFEAFPVFAELDPAINWQAVSDAGVELVRRARVKGNGLPPDWLVLNDDGQVRAAPDFPAEFGYNGIRIPLYMMRAGINPVLLDPFRNSADEQGLYKVDAVTGEKLEPISEPGYRLISAAMECVAAGTSIPDDLTTMAPTSYYAATLQLLLLDYLRRDHADCLGATAS